MRRVFLVNQSGNRNFDKIAVTHVLRAIRKRAAQINTLVAQMQDWVHTDDVEFDAIRTLLEHLPSVLVRFESPLLVEMQLPLSEMMLAISDTARPAGEVEGLEVVPNDCPEIQERPEDDLGPFRKAFEEK